MSQYVSKRRVDGALAISTKTNPANVADLGNAHKILCRHFQFFMRENGVFPTIVWWISPIVFGLLFGFVARLHPPYGGFVIQLLYEQYIRSDVTGGTFFFTVNLAERKNNDLLIRHVDILRDAFRETKNRHPFTIDAILILPEHLHTMWTLPENDNDYSMRWRLIKTYFSRHLPKTERISPNRQSRNERGIWQRRFWEHTIRDDKDYENHVDYIHYNPVKHGYVKSVGDWQYSSFHRFVKLGTYDAEMG